MNNTTFDNGKKSGHIDKLPLLKINKKEFSGFLFYFYLKIDDDIV